MEDKKPIDDDLMDINADADIPGNTHLSNASYDRHEDEEKLVQELAEQKDKYLRLVAEFDNYKRRNARERMELQQSAGKDIIISLLDVMDDTERAEKQLQTSTDIEQVRAGVSLVFNKLKNIMQQKGLTPMESIDTDFDVEKHEAIAEVENEGKKGKVTDEVQKGYYLNNKILRFAKVVVGK